PPPPPGRVAHESAGRDRPPASSSAAIPSRRFLVQVVPGLEEIAADEIAGAIPDAEFVAAWKKFDERASLLEYRSSHQPRQWLALGTVEDVFALAARARSIRGDRAGLSDLAAAILTSKYFERAMAALRACQPSAPRTFRVVARKSGQHEFRRVDAQRTAEAAIGRRLPALQLVPDDAAAEFWLTVVDREALLGVRLSTKELRQRAQPVDSIAASLKPTVARAMALLSRPRPTDVVLDPLCGAGTLLIERAAAAPFAALIGGDRDVSAVAKARANAAAAGLPIEVREWDALALPLADASVDVVLTNPPFGKKVEILDADPRSFYRRLLAELQRVLRPNGRLVLVTSQVDAAQSALRALPSPAIVRRRVPVLIRGERATIFAIEKAAEKAVAAETAGRGDAPY
ncbi:MAG TPA: methyltransferase, partial [Chloroflexota bacterium]|nr:methyltransferase [Chloroflexota bacterium]